MIEIRDFKNKNNKSKYTNKYIKYNTNSGILNYVMEYTIK